MNIKAISAIPKRGLIAFLRLYQKTLSPDHGWFRVLFPGGYCRFTPSCSQYAILSIEKYGVLGGIPRAVWRILRCNPFSSGGQDFP